MHSNQKKSFLTFLLHDETIQYEEVGQTSHSAVRACP